MNYILLTALCSCPGNLNVSATLPHVAGHSHKTSDTEVMCRLPAIMLFTSRLGTSLFSQLASVHVLIELLVVCDLR